MHEDIRREAASRRTVEEAAEWMLAQREGLDDSARAAFVAWLRHSPAHVAEYLAIVEWEREMHEAAAREPLDDIALASMAAAESSVVSLHGDRYLAARSAVLTRVQPAVPLSRRRWPRIASAAGLVLALTAAGAWLTHLPPAGTLYSASAEATLKVTLADGSRIQLDRGSRIRVDLAADRRDITVLSGTMLIDVGHTRTAPLRVTTGSTTLRDIGTVFQVRARDGGSEVTVLSGGVDVLAPRMTLAKTLNLPEGHRDVLAHLRGGQRATLSNRGTLATLDNRADLAKDMAWLPGEIEFHDMPVSDVARRFNDYGLKPIVIEDNAVAATRLSGRFHGRDPAGFVAYLQTLPGVLVSEDDHGVHVTRWPASGPLPRL